MYRKKNETYVIFFTYSKGKHWKTDGISNVSYKSGERLITFSLETFGPVTLIQDTHINMPYQSWELRPLDVNRVLLTVTTVFTEIQIHIKVIAVTVSHIQEVNLIEDCKRVWQSYQSLVNYMLKCFLINMFNIYLEL